MEPSETIEAHIREAAERLELFCDDIMGCRVLVDTPHQHHHKGKRHHVRIDLTVPGAEFVIKRSPRLLTDSPTRYRKAPDQVELEESRELSKYATHDIDNLGRHLISVRWDIGITDYVFPSETEIIQEVRLA